MEDLVLQQGYSRYDCSYEPESNTTEACIRYSVQWLYILHNIIIMYYYDYTLLCIIMIMYYVLLWLLLCIIMIIHFAVVSVPTILQIYVACTGL